MNFSFTLQGIELCSHVRRYHRLYVMNGPFVGELKNLTRQRFPTLPFLFQEMPWGSDPSRDSLPYSGSRKLALCRKCIKV